jgi:ribosomal protein L37AE/L43A
MPELNWSSMNFTSTIWIAQNQEGEPTPFLVASSQDLKNSPVAKTINDLFNLGMEGEDIFYLLPTDCYFLINNVKGSLTIALYKTTESADEYLLKYTVTPEWLALAKKQQSFVWVIIGDDLTQNQAAQFSELELVEKLTEGELDLFAPWLYRDFQELIHLSTCETCGSTALNTFVRDDYYFVQCTACDQELAGANWQVIAPYLKGEVQAMIENEVIAKGKADLLTEKILQASLGKRIQLIRV